MGKFNAIICGKDQWSVIGAEGVNEHCLGQVRRSVGASEVQMPLNNARSCMDIFGLLQMCTETRLQTFQFRLTLRSCTNLVGSLDWYLDKKISADGAM